MTQYEISSTLAFTSNDDNSYPETNKIVTIRDNSGGWYYNVDNGEFYANLPNGAYTHDTIHEIWNGETSPKIQTNSYPHHYNSLGSPKKINATTVPNTTKHKISNIPKAVYHKPNKINCL